MSSSLSLLPMGVTEIELGLISCASELEVKGISQEEAFLKIYALFESWLDEGVKAAPLPIELRPLLANASWAIEAPKAPHSAFVDLIRKLEGRYAGTRREAVIILSQLPLMLLLAREFACSPAKIANVIGASNGRSLVTWRSVQTILSYFKITSKLDESAVTALLRQDALESTDELGDADIETMVQLLVEKSSTFGLSSEFRDSLSKLFAPEIGEPFIPYLQALLYVSVVDCFYDHPSEFIYTFNPRGNAANLIFSLFPSALAPGGNPILNNFKALDRLTLDWAESREDTRAQATALVTIVLGMSSLSFAARQNFSAAIRRGIFRFLEVSTPAKITLPDVESIGAVGKFLKKVSGTPTGTKGIIEQRVTDFIAAMQHMDTKWRSRGMGDPVNATNSSSRKLGDCDFQDASDRVCHAVESHAGRLSDIYVEEHLRTLRLNLPKRMEEWSGISEVGDWALNITFIAHEDARNSQANSAPSELQCSLNVVTFADVSNQIMELAEINQQETISLFNRWVVFALNSRNTPHETKKKAKVIFEE